MAQTINVGNVVGPQGPQGPQGIQGERGLQGEQGIQGIQGEKGENAKINGRNTINIVAGENIDIEQVDDTLTISGQDGGLINSISVNGTTQPIVDKNVDITVPTNTSDLTNNSGFITKSVNDLVNYYLKSETYTQTEVNNLIGSISSFHYEVVQQLPAVGETNILYLVPRTTTEVQNIYDEYVYANNNWEKVGSTDIDLSNYVTITDLNTALADYTTTTDLTTLLATKANVSDIPTKTSDLTNDSGYIDTETDPVFSNSPASGITNQDISNWNNKPDYTAGTNIQINNGVISATDTTYTPATTSSNGLMSSTDKTKLDGINTSEYINYKGHVNTESDLPVFSQTSGTITTDYIRVNDNRIKSNVQFTYPVPAKLNKEKAMYYIFYGAINNDEPYFCASSDNPGFIKGMGLVNSGNYPADKVLFYIDASETYPVNFAISGVEPTGYYADTETLESVTITTGMILTRPVQITIGTSTSYGSTVFTFNHSTSRFLGNIPGEIKFFNNPIGVVSLNKIYTTLQRSAGGFVWENGMHLLGFSSNGNAQLIADTTVSSLGDTYTVGDDYDIYYRNSVPAWEKWSKIDLTNYYDKTETDTLLNSKQNTLTAGENITIVNNTISSTDTTYSNATTSTAGLMSSADKTKLDDIDTNLLINYKGHVSTENDLPSLGQPSGTTGSNVVEVNNTVLDNWIAYISDTTTYQSNIVITDNTVASTHTYYFVLDRGQGSSRMNSYVIIGTNYPEQISIVPRTVGVNSAVYLKAEYDANKPVQVYYYKGTGIASMSIEMLDSSGNFISLTNGGATNITEDVEIGIFNGSTASWYCHFYTNYTGPILMKNGVINTVTRDATDYIVADTLENTETNYIWNTNMILLFHRAYQKDITSTKLGDTYTVGNNYDIYYRNALPAWEKWSKADTSDKLDKSSVKTTNDTTQGNVYDVTYINTMLGDIESLLGGI